MKQTGVQCRTCGESIYSNHRHDFVTCKCGATFVDGGWDYLRVGGDVAIVDDKLVTVHREIAKRTATPFREELQT